MLRGGPDFKRGVDAPGLDLAPGRPCANCFKDSACEDVPGGIKIELDRAQGDTVLQNRDVDPLVGASAEHSKVVLIFFLPENAGLERGTGGAVTIEKMLLTPGELKCVGNGTKVFRDPFG